MNFEPTRTRAQLMLIAQDMADDARAFDGKPLDGKAVGECFGNHGAAIARIAEIVGVLCERVDALEQQVCAVMEQQGLQTRKLHRIADGFASIAYESTGWNPVPLADFLPEGPEHLHDSGPCWGADCFTAVTKDPVDCPRCGGLDGTHTLRGCGSAQGPVDAEPAEVQ
jgi:hypothetical protein